MDTEDVAMNVASTASEPVQSSSSSQSMDVDETVSVVSVDSEDNADQQGSVAEDNTNKPGEGAYKSSFMNTCWDIDNFMDTVVTDENQTMITA